MTSRILGTLGATMIAAHLSCSSTRHLANAPPPPDANAAPVAPTVVPAPPAQAEPTTVPVPVTQHPPGTLRIERSKAKDAITRWIAGELVKIVHEPILVTTPGVHVFPLEPTREFSHAYICLFVPDGADLDAVWRPEARVTASIDEASGNRIAHCAGQIEPNVRIEARERDWIRSGGGGLSYFWHMGSLQVNLRTNRTYVLTVTVEPTHSGVEAANLIPVIMEHTGK